MNPVPDRKTKGFTLIELLVVISIISLLSSIVLTSVNSARGKARDIARKQALVQLRTALELYRTDNGRYPSHPGDPPTNSKRWCSSSIENTNGPGSANHDSNCTSTNYIPGLVPTYISSLPTDPLPGPSANDGCSGYYKAYMYEVNKNGSDYGLLSYCAVDNDVNPTDIFYGGSPFLLQVCSTPPSSPGGCVTTTGWTW